MQNIKPQASSLKPQASSLNLTIKEGLNKSKLSILEEEELLRSVIDGYLALLAQQTLPTECPAKVKEFYLLLLGNLFNGYRINEAKAECGFRDQNFSRLFAKWVGMKPKEFCLEHTMAVGAFLLCETSCSIAGIALALGFQDQDAFGKAIKRKFWIGPSQLRHQSKKNT